VRDLRKLLPRTYHVFFGRFQALTEIQARGIPPITAGRDVLLCAPTAAGKTEAYAAPLVERVLHGPRHPLSVLIVSPTRALANDLKRRLESRMLDAGVRFGRVTGEHKERVDGNLPEVVVTTPEAFDALLARRCEAIRSVRAVVLDEIHILDGTPRGDQVRFLLHRLDRLIGGAVQKVAVSATVADAYGLSGRYLNDAEIVCASGQRKIRARAFPGTSVAEIAAHLEAIAGAGFRKVLAFCNSRKDVEWYAASLREARIPFGKKVFPHHGSLARRERERSERLFLEAPAALCLATLTLELGIDIGTIDYVFLLGVPPSVSSLLQRIGRGSRRGSEIRVGYACADEGERFLYRVLLERGARGDLCSDPYAPRPSVILQQALVAAGAHGYVTAESLGAFMPPALSTALPSEAIRSILDRMAEQDLLERPRSRRYVLAGSYERRYDAGVLHGNLAVAREVEIIDRTTGDVVGAIAPTRRSGSRFQLGGRGRRLVKETQGRIFSDSTQAATPPIFTPRGQPSISFRLARAVVSAFGAGEDEILQVRHGPTHLVLHGLGKIGGLLFERVLARIVGKRRIMEVTPFVARLSKELQELPRPTDEEVARFVSEEERRLATVCTMGPFHHHLPPDLRRSSVSEASFVAGIVAFLRGARLVDADFTPALRPLEFL
jgi:ATP-dependent Lhr-like helicase